MKLAPFILEVPRDHKIFEMGAHTQYSFDEILADEPWPSKHSLVEMHFQRAWKTSPTPMPDITRVFKIIEDEDFQSPYDLYRFVFRKEVRYAA